MMISALRLSPDALICRLKPNAQTLDIGALDAMSAILNRYLHCQA